MMRKFIAILLVELAFLFNPSMVNAQFNQFTFLKGNTTDYRYGSYGTQGVASVSNNPGKKSWSTSWESNGKFYVFGGEGVASQLSSPGGNAAPPEGYLNDLWEYDPPSKNWRWLKGSNLLGASPTSGTQGVAAFANTPGSRKAGMNWTVGSKLYLFGGFITYIYLGHVNDLWEFDINTGNWRWLNGSPTSINLSPIYGTQGVFDAANQPGGREGSATWVNNGKLYLFGGSTRIGGVDVNVNDLWEYDPSVNQWRWLSGPQTGNNIGTYGTKGVAAPNNIPGSRIESAVTVIGSKAYLFGGDGFGTCTANCPMDDVWEYDHSTGYWTWLNGSSTSGAPKVTGTQGVYGMTVSPGARSVARMTSYNNTIYLQGGFTWYTGLHADLWQFDPSISQWRWIKGPSSTNQLGNYGFQGVEDPAGATFPGSRYDGKLHTINNKLFCFGGRGYSGVSSASDERQNDLWSFDPSTIKWTWEKGASGKERFGEYGTQGIASATNKPGERLAHVMASLNNKIYMFGGDGNRGYNFQGWTNDLWEYDPASNNWKFLKGTITSELPDNYGIQGVPNPSNLPGSRDWPNLWGLNNKIYMFGGWRRGYKNDMWEYDPATNNWTWLKGSSGADQPGVYGTKGIAAPGNTPGGRSQAASFTYNNKLYLFGGEGYSSTGPLGLLNDLWEYDPATNNWTWINGDDAVNVFGVYGTMGVADAANKPGARVSANAEIINNKIYLFGNWGYGPSGSAKLMNDLWEYDFPSGLWKWIKGSNTGTAGGSTGTLGIEAVTNMPGARGGSTGYTIGGKLYIFGGTPNSNNYNDLWEYNPATNNWRWIAGPGNVSNQRGNYGLTGIGSHTNLPTARKNLPVAVIGNSAYLFGGIGQYANNVGENFNNLGDMWKWVAGPNGGFTYGTERKIYVNDNNLGGNTYTTAIGNNSNTGSPSDPLATLDYAVSVAQPGDTIFVDAGTYVTPDFTIGKALTILGPNSTISPNDATDPLLYNTARNAEAIISNSNITIGSGNINIEGLTFDPLAKFQFFQINTASDFSNIKISDNRFIVSTNFGAMYLTGRNITPLTSSNYFIINNRFEKTGGTSNINIYLSLINNAHVSGNVFTAANATLAKIQSAIVIGPLGKVDNLTIARNVFDRSSIPIQTLKVGATLIDDNKSYNCLSGFDLRNSISEPAIVTVTNNYFTNTQQTGAVAYNRTGANDNSSPNRFICENNTVIMDATGQTSLNYELVTSFVESTIINANIETVIKKNLLNYTGDFSLVTSSVNRRGISIMGRHTNILIEDNEINLNGVGLPSIDHAGITIFSVASGTSTGVIPANAIINILNNKIHGFKYSIAIRNTQYGQFGGLLTGITANINNNSFTGDVISINNGTTSQTVNASCNWYGVTSAQAVLNKITPTTVNYSPWLTNGTDNDIPTVGFQPLPAVCNGTPVVVALDAFTNITCNGDNDGTINITVSGGLASYTFAWTKDEDPGFSSSDEDLTNLAPGTYQLLLTDANGSTVTLLNVTINEPEVLTAEASGTNNICFGATEGSAIALPGGGTAPYTFLWSNAETTEEITGLAAGIYSVTVTDANGCTAIANYEVTQPSQLTATITNTSTACANSASVAASGGTVAAAYSYLWSNGATGTTISNVPAGTYTVTITDDNGCTTSANVDLTTNEAFNPSAQVTDVSCFGESDGTMTVTNVNGAAPFLYSIDGFNFQSENVFENLSAGTYTITVADANGCTGFVTKTITQPPLLTVVLNNVQSTCFGTSTGAITVTAVGGTGGLSYAWSGPNGYTSSQKNLSNLAVGTYVITVTDNNGCTAQINAVVSNYNEIIVTPAVINIACKGELNGSINLTISGGTGSGFTYLWTNGATTKNITNLGVGNYSVIITDIGSGCVVNRSYSITQPSSIINLTASKTNATGCSSLGTITAIGSGGTSSYQYKLDNGNYQSSGSFTGLYAGNFTVWVRDANGCTNSKAVSITDNGSDQYESNNSKNQAKLIYIGTTISARIALSTDVADWFKFTTASGGNYILSLTHPSVNYTFNLYAAGNNTPALVPVSSAAGSKTYTLAGSTAYYISIAGGLSYNCYQLLVSASALPIARTSSNEQVIYFDKPFSIEVLKLEARVFPNPHHGLFNLQINSPENGWANIELFNGNGQKIISKRIAIKKGENTVNFSNIKESLLLYKISIGKNFVTGKVIGPN